MTKHRHANLKCTQIQLSWTSKQPLRDMWYKKTQGSKGWMNQPADPGHVRFSHGVAPQWWSNWVSVGVKLWPTWNSKVITRFNPESMSPDRLARTRDTDSCDGDMIAPSSDIKIRTVRADEYHSDYWLEITLPSQLPMHVGTVTVSVTVMVRKSQRRKTRQSWKSQSYPSLHPQSTKCRSFCPPPLLYFSAPTELLTAPIFFIRLQNYTDMLNMAQKLWHQRSGV